MVVMVVVVVAVVVVAALAAVAVVCNGVVEDVHSFLKRQKVN